MNLPIERTPERAPIDVLSALSPTANLVYLRSYHRQGDVDWLGTVQRCTEGLAKLGELTDEEKLLLFRMHRDLYALPSGRWHWVGGTEWLDKPENLSGAFNCTSTPLDDPAVFGYLMDLAMMGSGTGAVLTQNNLDKMPKVRNTLEIEMTDPIGLLSDEERSSETRLTWRKSNDATVRKLTLEVGDSRQGWVKAYQTLIDLAFQDFMTVESAHIEIEVSLAHIRPAGIPLKGFGGVSNPAKLPGLFPAVARIMNAAIGRKLNSVEASLLIDEAALTVVAGNIRRCLPEYAMVHTERGLVEIKDVQVGDMVHTPIGLRRVTDKFDQGIQEVYYIETVEHVVPFLATINHKMAVYPSCDDPQNPTTDLSKLSWKTLEELHPGEHLVYRGYSGTTDRPVVFYDIYAWGMVQTYDIEVEEAHCFYCDGYLTHNSAGMRQGDSDDAAFVVAKDNLWQEDPETKQWRIDPARDALRMANHTRVFMKPPTYEEVLESVTKQFRSGEGAIQYAPEAIARSNVDLFTIAVKRGLYGHASEARFDFISAINKDRFSARAWLLMVVPDMSDEEVEDRLERFGLNPCFAAGTMVHTSNGDFPIEKLVGQSVEVWDGNNWVLIDNFRLTGNDQPVMKLTLKSGQTVKATLYHTFILENGSRVDMQALKVGDRLKVATGVSVVQSIDAEIARIEYAGIAPNVYCCTVPTNNSFTLSNGLLVGNCGEITGTSFHCNLGEVHLNRLDPYNEQQQRDAFHAAGLSVAVLLRPKFVIDRYQKARELDPIVGVSFTGLFDFFVHAFGVDWLRWWEAGRPDYWTPTQLDPNTPDPSLQLFYDEHYGYLSTYYIDREQYYLKLWKDTAHAAVWDYCDRHGLKRPNRCTTVQPAGTKSLLSNASPGWHPPKAQRFIRRITFGVDDPVVKAGMDFGYSVVPGQEDKDEQGNLLNDPFDPRVTTWLLEVPVEVDWASLPGADQIHIEKFSIEAQFSFYMQVQRYYVTHNGSATWEITEAEIPTAAKLIHNAIVNNHGYMSATLLARYDVAFPRLPFERIDQATYTLMVEEMKSRQKSDNFLALYQQYAANRFETGPADSACSSSFCESR